MKTYEERRNESAENYANSMLPDNEDAHGHPAILAVGICSENGFIRGSDFGRADAIMEVVSFIRTHAPICVDSSEPIIIFKPLAEEIEKKFGVK